MGIYSRKDEEYILRRDKSDAEKFKKWLEEYEEEIKKENKAIEKNIDSFIEEYNDFLSFLKTLPKVEKEAMPNGVTYIYPTLKENHKKTSVVDFMRVWGQENREIFPFLKKHLKKVYIKKGVYYIPQLALYSLTGCCGEPVAMRARCAVLLDMLGSKEPFLDYFKKRTGKEFTEKEGLWIFKDKDEVIFKNGQSII